MLFSSGGCASIAVQENIIDVDRIARDVVLLYLEFIWGACRTCMLSFYATVYDTYVSDSKKKT